VAIRPKSRKKRPPRPLRRRHKQRKKRLRRQRGNLLRVAWRLAMPYWKSEEKAAAWLLTAGIVALNLGNVYVDVRLNQWNNAFYNALQDFNAPEFFRQLAIFCLLATLAIVCTVYAVYFQQMLQIRWRRWLTHRYLHRWLGDRTYYHLQLDRQTTDNPDQRISDDLNQFTNFSIVLSLGLLTSVVSLASFLVILVGLSGPAKIELGSWGNIYIPFYLVWAALIYAGLGTWLTLRIGRPMVPLSFAQQRLEADFRYSLVRLRDNAESVALYGGERAEQGIFSQRFGFIYANFWRIMVRRRLLNWFTSGYSQIAVVIPVLVVAPRYFTKAIQLGGLMQVIDAFNSVLNSLSFIINSFASQDVTSPSLATWAAVVQRLSSFSRRMEQIDRSLAIGTGIGKRRSGKGVAVAKLDIDLPDAKPLLRGVALEAGAGEALLLTGPSGIGKSTLLRALAGIWPFGAGDIRLDEGNVFFMPQRPYLPLGTLRQALVYPQSIDEAKDSHLADLLRQVGLGEFADRLDDSSSWSQRLSLGEQQRLAFARVLLAKPDLIFLDEATSAVDEDVEAELYKLLRQSNPKATIVSIGHRASLVALHDRALNVGRFGAKPK